MTKYLGAIQTFADTGRDDALWVVSVLPTIVGGKIAVKKRIIMLCPVRSG